MVTEKVSSSKDEKKSKHSPINRYVTMRQFRASRVSQSNNSVRENASQPTFRRGSIEARMQSENLGIVFLD